MRRCAPSRLRSKHRLVSHRLKLEELESRLPPGDMIGLTGTALWGLSLGVEGRGLRPTPLAITQAPLFRRQNIDSAIARFAPSSTSTQISFVPSSRTATYPQSIVTPARGVEQHLADQDIFDCALPTPFDASRPAHRNPRVLSQEGLGHANQTDLMRGPMSEGGGGGSRLASSAEPIPQPPGSMASGNFPLMSAPAATPNTQTKTATSSTMPAPANPAGNVMPPGQGMPLPNNGMPLGGSIHPDMPESTTPPMTPT